MVDMPKEEDVQALCLGQGWAAAATSALLVRIFSMGGVQREIFSLPGPVVCMSAHGEQLMIVYHRGKVTCWERKQHGTVKGTSELIYQNIYILSNGQ